MLDNQLIQIIAPLIDAGLILQGYTGVPVVQSNQPTQQGINDSATVYLFKMNDKRFGYAKIVATWDPILRQETQVNSQKLETTFQVSALVIQTPGSVGYTASDLVNAVALTLNSGPTVEALAISDLAILRISNVRNDAFTDDKDRFEYMPGFDFTIEHEQTLNIVVNVATPITGTITKI